MYSWLNQLAHGDRAADDVDWVRSWSKWLKYIHLTAFVRDADSPKPYLILLFLILFIKATVYLFIGINLSKDIQSNKQTVSDKVLRLLYIFNFYLFFVPVTDCLSTILKCYGSSRLFTSRIYPFCSTEKSVFLPISLTILTIKITINIIHEICDVEKKIKFAQKWSK